MQVFLRAGHMEAAKKILEKAIGGEGVERQCLEAAWGELVVRGDRRLRNLIPGMISVLILSSNSKSDHSSSGSSGSVSHIVDGKDGSNVLSRFLSRLIWSEKEIDLLDAKKRENIQKHLSIHEQELVVENKAAIFEGMGVGSRNRSTTRVIYESLRVGRGGWEEGAGLLGWVDKEKEVNEHVDICKAVAVRGPEVSSFLLDHFLEEEAMYRIGILLLIMEKERRGDRLVVLEGVLADEGRLVT